MQKIDYEGTVWVLNYNNPEPLLDHSIHMLEKHGVKRNDMTITETPTTKVGDIVVEIWPYELVIGRVRTTRNEDLSCLWKTVVLRGWHSSAVRRATGRYTSYTTNQDEQENRSKEEANGPKGLEPEEMSRVRCGIAYPQENMQLWLPLLQILSNR